jgi:uncharacterized protein (TIGR03435 family)
MMSANTVQRAIKPRTLAVVLLRFAMPALLMAQAVAPAAVKTPVYDAVSIKVSKAEAGSWSTNTDGDRFSATNVSIKNLLAEATGVRSELISGIPEPIASARFDIEAKVVEPDIEALKKLTTAQRDSMVLAILLERFKLSDHIESKVLPIYELQLLKGGPKFKESSNVDAKDQGTHIQNREMKAAAITMASLADTLSHQIQRIVIDKTGLTKTYDMTLKWSAEDGSDTNPDAPPVIFTAVREQLGLKLESAKGADRDVGRRPCRDAVGELDEAAKYFRANERPASLH